MRGAADADRTDLTVPAEFNGLRAHEVLRDCLPLEPLEFLRHLLESDKVLRNGAPCAKRRVLEAGDVLTVRGVEDERKAFQTRSIPVDVLYEDEHVLVLNKPAGCTVVRRRNQEHCAFQNGILDYLRQSPVAREAAMSERYRPRAVHRLDQDTTGAIVEAKTRAGELHISDQIQDRRVRKEYLAVVHGELAEDSGTIEKPIGPVEGDISQMKIGGRHGKASLTEYEVAERFRGVTCVNVVLHTGRRHQIRLHFAHLGHSIVADTLYGGGEGFYLSSVKQRYKTAKGAQEKPIIARPALHASAVTFLPVGAETPVRVEAPLPHDMTVLLKMLRKYG